MIYTGNQEKNADYYDQIYKNGYNTANYNSLYKEVINILANLNNPRVLELGCGLGDLGIKIMDKGWSYRGFDFSQEAINICKKNHHRPISIRGMFMTRNLLEPMIIIL